MANFLCAKGIHQQGPGSKSTGRRASVPHVFGYRLIQAGNFDQSVQRMQSTGFASIPACQSVNADSYPELSVRRMSARTSNRLRSPWTGTKLARIASGIGMNRRSFRTIVAVGKGPPPAGASTGSLV